MKNHIEWIDDGDGNWSAVTTNFKLVAALRSQEAINAMEPDSPFRLMKYVSLLYFWSDAEGVWVLRQEDSIGSVSLEQAQRSAELLLSEALNPGPRSNSPFGSINPILLRMLEEARKKRK